ncbi:MAG: type IV pilus assembly protein PilM [Pseudomonadota bacterium]
MIFKKKSSVVGLDIGSSSIKLVKLVKDGDRVHLENCGMMPIPRQAIVESAIMDSNALMESIRELYSSLKLKDKNVAIAISGNSVIIKKISLQMMTKEELNEAIKWEAEQYIPFDIKDVNLDYYVIPYDDAAEQMEVVLVAAKSDMINDYTSLCVSAGLNPIMVDVGVFSIENCFTYNYQLISDEVYVLANFGASMTNINILQRGYTSFTRDINIGGDFFTDEIQKQLNIPFEQAEALKMGRVYSNKESKQKAVIPTEVQNSLRTSTENLAMELHKSVEYFATTNPDVDISKIYISGGTAKISGIIEALAMEIDKPVFILNPFEQITLSEGDFDLQFIKEMRPVFASATGLSLRGLNV